MTNDQQLWHNFKAGDKAAFEQIYRQEIGFLGSYGRSLCSEKSLVEDCIQELFVEIWKSKSNLADNISIRSYLLVALRRKLLKPAQKIAVVDLPVEMSDDDHNIEDKIINEEGMEWTKSTLDKAIELLSRQQKEVLNLKFYQDKNYDEISALMGITYQSCRNLVSQAVRQLQNNAILYKKSVYK
ncbi:MAG: sigma-70 family RNA polymerase sigma factor [Saprospiraceae bacterium]|nr:sigma-70 family RNA polymerase sigma factor [Saprospiraceae bacterium]